MSENYKYGFVTDIENEPTKSSRRWNSPTGANSTSTPSICRTSSITPHRRPRRATKKLKTWIRNSWRLLKSSASRSTNRSDSRTSPSMPCSNISVAWSPLATTTLQPSTAPSLATEALCTFRLESSAPWTFPPTSASTTRKQASSNVPHGPFHLLPHQQQGSRPVRTYIDHC